jgi:hypothetical protein
MANNAFDQANSALLLAQAAYNQANVDALPAGSNQWIQFNDNGTVGANSHFRFNKNNSTVYVESLDVAHSINISGDIVPQTTGQALGQYSNRWYDLYLDGGIYANGSFGNSGDVLTNNDYGTLHWVQLTDLLNANSNVSINAIDNYARGVANSGSIYANIAINLAQSAYNKANSANTIFSGNSTPGGSNYYVQYNNNGQFGGSSSFTYNQNTATLTVPKVVATNDISPIGPNKNLGDAGNTWYNLYLSNGLSASGSFGGPGQVLSTNQYGVLQWVNLSSILSSNSNVTIYTIDDYARSKANGAYFTANSAGIYANTALEVALLAFNQANAAHDNISSQAAGSNGYIQFNSNGNFAANSNFTYNSKTQSLNVTAINVGSLSTTNDIVPKAFDISLGQYNHPWYNLYLQNGIWVNGSFGSPNQVLGTNDYGTLQWIDIITIIDESIANVTIQTIDHYARQTANSAQSTATSALSLAQAAYNNSLLNPTAVAAYNTANTALVLAQDAYNAANAAASSAFTQAAFNQANTATTLAQNSYNFANTRASSSYANAAFLQANSANILAQAAFNQANVDLIFAQASFNVANLASANTIYTQGVDNTQNTLINNLIVTSGSGSNVANSASANTIYTQGVDLAQNTTISNLTTYAQAGFGVANSASANTVYLQAVNNYQNTVITNVNSFAQASFNVANSASANTIYLQGVNDTQNSTVSGLTTYAQAGFALANTAVQRAGDTMTGTLTINNVTDSISVTSGALIVSGGVGISSNLYANNVYSQLFVGTIDAGIF